MASSPHSKDRVDTSLQPAVTASGSVRHTFHFMFHAGPLTRRPPAHSRKQGQSVSGVPTGKCQARKHAATDNALMTQNTTEKQDLNKCKNILHTWIARLDIFKGTIPPNSSRNVVRVSLKCTCCSLIPSGPPLQAPCLPAPCARWSSPPAPFPAPYYSRWQNRPPPLSPPVFLTLVTHYTSPGNWLFRPLH